MNVKFEDFNGIFENAFSDEFCDMAMGQFDRAVSMGYGLNRQDFEGVGSHIKDDMAITTGMNVEMPAEYLDRVHREFLTKFWTDIYPHYSAKYSALNDVDKHTIFCQKLQRTAVGGGYHVWHSEHAKGMNRNRLLTYILYLNDVDEGGETEFLYLHKRYKPKKGTLIISPSNFTHTHRGNPPLSNTKYILTGWVEFQ